MQISAGTFTHVEPQHQPNDGRVIINHNFDLIEDLATTILSGVTSGNTIVFSGTNTSILSGYTIGSGASPYYIVSVIDSPIFTSVSATSISASTFYSGDTNLGDLISNLIPPANNTYTTQFSVSATGVDNYTGVSAPALTGYNITDIYLTQFENTNTTGATLNIDGLGALNVLKGTDSGLTSLEIGEVQTGVTYFLTYDGDQFQFFDSSPEGTPGTYTNLSPATATVGGILAGTTFSGATWQSIFDTMFHPTLTPSFSTFTISSQSQTLEVGDSVSGGTRIFNWSVLNQSYIKPNSIKIYNVTSGNVVISIPSSGITGTTTTITGLTNTQKTSQTTHTWRSFATKTNNSTFYKDFTVGWYWRRMYGVSSAETISTSNEINVFSGTGALATTMATTYTMNGAGYKYFFVPGTFAHPTLIKDQATQLAIAMADATDNAFFSGASGTYRYGNVVVTNQFGIALNYRVYRTRNLLNGNITIIVT